MQKELYEKAERAVEKYKNKNYEEAYNLFKSILLINKEFLEKNYKYYYLWAIFQYKINITSEEIDLNYKEFQENVKFIIKNINKDELLYNLTIFKVIDYIKHKPNFQAKKLNVWLDKLNPIKLNSESFSFKTKDGKLGIKASQKEEWYTLKTKVLEKLGMYKECFDLCKETLNNLDEFNNNNDIWLRRRLAISLSNLEKNEEALDILKEIVYLKNEWFIQKDIGDIYLKKNDYNKALEYYIEAALNRGIPDMKISLFWKIGEVFNKINKKELEEKHKIYTILLRNKNKWSYLKEEEKFFKKSKNTILNFQEKELYFELKKIWENYKWNNKISYNGKVKNILPNNKAGFISSQEGNFYFKIQEVKNKNRDIIVGKSVKFYLEKSFDKKKNKETQIAVNIDILD